MPSWYPGSDFFCIEELLGPYGCPLCEMEIVKIIVTSKTYRQAQKLILQEILGTGSLGYPQSCLKDLFFPFLMVELSCVTGTLSVSSGAALGPFGSRIGAVRQCP